jgi:hypothetical protein
VALATTLCRERGWRSAARQDPQARQGADRGGNHGAGGCADLHRTAAPGEPLAKLTDIVGLYVDPLADAVVLSIDEKSQIQALDRTQPGPTIKPWRCQTMTHDYKRHGTAALSVLDGTVIGRWCSATATSNSSACSIPSSAGKVIHTVLDEKYVLDD